MMSLHEVEEQLNVWGWPHHPWEVTVGNYHLAFNPKTMIMTWVTMILVAIFAVAATRNMNMRRPGGAQNVLEMMFEGIRNLVNQNMDPKKGAALLSIVVTYFIFILFSNLIGLVPTLSSPTADYNTTLALALCTFFLIYYFGIKYKGLGYFKHYIQPYVFFLPITIIEDFSKPITLTFRLYGNIYGGEVLIAVLLALLGGWIHVFGGFIASVVWLAFSIFVGFIQAFIFTMLSIAYVSQAVADHDHH
ncbi:MAG: F0F1 ATP synthase subunit A [Peptococcaceae bacterium]|nr:F0F1 ATP synthase subunit A [Peptococcaceae bacterium]